MPATTRPRRQRNPLLQHVPAAGGVVAIAGDEDDFYHGPSPDTWVWNGKTWRRLQVRPLPTLRSQFFYTTLYDYHSSQRRLLLLHDVHFSYATTI